MSPAGQCTINPALNAVQFLVAQKDGVTDEPVRALIALSMLAEHGIEQYQGIRISAEWGKGGELVCGYLGLAEDETADLLEELHEMFDVEQ